MQKYMTGSDFFAQQAMPEASLKEFVEFSEKIEPEEGKDEQLKELREAYRQHLIWRFNYPQKTFGKQKVYSIVISFVVLVLILSGLFFAFLQLKHALEVGSFENLTSELTVDAAGKVSIKSSIIGAVVLVISLAFFYLYLKNVFKIHYPIPPLVGTGKDDLDEMLTEKIKNYAEELKKASNAQPQ